MFYKLSLMSQEVDHYGDLIEEVQEELLQESKRHKKIVSDRRFYHRPIKVSSQKRGRILHKKLAMLGEKHARELQKLRNQTDLLSAKIVDRLLASGALKIKKQNWEIWGKFKPDELCFHIYIGRTREDERHGHVVIDSKTKKIVYLRPPLAPREGIYKCFRTF